MNDVGWRFAQNTSTTEMPQNHITVLPQNLPLSIVIYIIQHNNHKTDKWQRNKRREREEEERRDPAGSGSKCKLTKQQKCNNKQQTTTTTTTTTTQQWHTCNLVYIHVMDTLIIYIYYLKRKTIFQRFCVNRRIYILPLSWIEYIYEGHDRSDGLGLLLPKNGNILIKDPSKGDMPQLSFKDINTMKLALSVPTRIGR